MIELRTECLDCRPCVKNATRHSLEAAFVVCNVQRNATPAEQTRVCVCVVNYMAVSSTLCYRTRRCVVQHVLPGPSKKSARTDEPTIIVFD